MISHKKIRSDRLYIDDELQKEILDDILIECEELTNRNLIIKLIMNKMLDYDEKKRPDFEALEIYLNEILSDQNN